uniref:Uncharacterized protein n=1 Tax=Anguilla anguilla TaxID=7936 RepID=A0A0E9TCC9_ANGAN
MQNILEKKGIVWIINAPPVHVNDLCFSTERGILWRRM